MTFKFQNYIRQTQLYYTPTHRWSMRFSHLMKVQKRTIFHRTHTSVLNSNLLPGCLYEIQAPMIEGSSWSPPIIMYVSSTFQWPPPNRLSPQHPQVLESKKVPQRCKTPVVDILLLDLPRAQGELQVHCTSSQVGFLTGALRLWASFGSFMEGK